MVRLNKITLRWLVLLLLLVAGRYGYAQRQWPRLPFKDNIPAARGPVESTEDLTNEQFMTYRQANGAILYRRTSTGQVLHGLVELTMYSDEDFGDTSVPTLSHSSSGRLVRGLQEGSWKIVSYGDENTYVKTYRHGILHGPFVALDSAKRPLYRTTFTNGTGYFKRYHRNGRLAHEMLYYHNLPHGWALSYAADGRLMEETLYQKGRIVRRVKHSNCK